MKKKYIIISIISILFWFNNSFAQENISLKNMNITENIPECNLNQLKDSIEILVVKCNELDSILKSKINYLKQTFPKVNKNIELSFDTNSSSNFIRITGNIPDYSINQNYRLIGVALINNFCIYIYNFTDLSLDKYICNTKSKLALPQFVDQSSLINTPTFFFYWRDSTFMEIIS